MVSKRIGAITYMLSEEKNGIARIERSGNDSVERFDIPMDVISELVLLNWSKSFFNQQEDE